MAVAVAPFAVVTVSANCSEKSEAVVLRMVQLEPPTLKGLDPPVKV